MTETQGNSRSIARLLITSLITNLCLVPSKGREREREREGGRGRETEKRDINACGVRKKREEVKRTTLRKRDSELLETS